MKPLLSAIAVVFLLFQGCDSSDPEPVLLENPEFRIVADTSYTVLPSGVKYFDFDIGDMTRARADSGELVLLDFHGWLQDGTLFDSSVLTRPVQFVIGEEAIIPGWNEGVEGMYLGGDRQLVIPPELAYGEEGNGLVPGNATLIFEIFLIGAE